jgi:hypothetical protein
MKTAMQELLQILEVKILPCNDDNSYVYNINVARNLINNIKEYWIIKEKEQIIDAHIEGQRVFDKYQHTQWTNDQAEEYYNQTYNQNK